MSDITVKLRITSILSRGKRGGAIASGVTEDDERYVVVYHRDLLADSALIERGQLWEVDGPVDLWEQERNGFRIKRRRIRSTRADLLRPAGKNIIQWIAQSPDCFGIGKVKATDLWETFGLQLIELIEQRDLEALGKVVTEESAQRLCHAMDKFKVASSLLWLDTIGLPARIGIRVVKYYKDKLQDALERNPYCLLSFEGRWDVVDNFARTRMGIAEDDPRRLEAAVEEVLYRGLNRGHTCLPKDQVRSRSRALLGPHSQLALERRSDRWYCANDMYHSAGGYVIECYIAERLKGMVIGTEAVGQQSLFTQEVDGEAIAKALDAFEAAQEFTLTPEQSQAVMTSASASVSLILGGAGTGKTTVLEALYAALEAALPGVAIYQAALAGRAAQRMTEATKRPSSTIAGLLMNSGQSRDPQPGDVVVVDEMSMVDAILFYRLLRFLPKGVRLIMVGDPSQLPPIGPGLVLHALAGHPAIPQTTLTQTKRQSAASGIPMVAASIRSHRTPVYAPYSGMGNGVSMVMCEDHQLDEQVLRIYQELGGTGEDYSVQILCPTKSGVGGTRNTNTNLHNRFCANAEPVHYYDIYGGHGVVQAASTERVLLRVGDLVMYRENDYEIGLRNGSLGRIVRALPVEDEESECCEVEWDDGRRLRLRTKHVHALQHAYGLTIHKSQGSQFKRVIVPIRRNRLLDQALIYTAVTRGVEQVVVVGNAAAANAAILAPPSASCRHVGLTALLAEEESPATS